HPHGAAARGVRRPLLLPELRGSHPPRHVRAAPPVGGGEGAARPARMGTSPVSHGGVPVSRAPRQYQAIPAPARRADRRRGLGERRPDLPAPARRTGPSRATADAAAAALGPVRRAHAAHRDGGYTMTSHDSPIRVLMITSEWPVPDGRPR